MSPSPFLEAARGASGSREAPAAAPNARGVRTQAHAPARARGDSSLTGQFGDQIKKLPRRAAGRLADRCDEIDALIASGQAGLAVLRAGQLVAGELAKLYRTDREAADRLRAQSAAAIVALAFEVAAIRTGKLREGDKGGDK
jgi:hypothetical protein